MFRGNFPCRSKVKSSRSESKAPALIQEQVISTGNPTRHLSRPTSNRTEKLAFRREKQASKRDSYLEMNRAREDKVYQIFDNTPHDAIEQIIYPQLYCKCAFDDYFGYCDYYIDDDLYKGKKFHYKCHCSPRSRAYDRALMNNAKRTQDAYDRDLCKPKPSMNPPILFMVNTERLYR
jgi:hypothetical protein